VKLHENLHDSVEALQSDLDAWLVHYDTLRPHLGNRNMGGRPVETVMSFEKQEGHVDGHLAAIEAAGPLFAEIALEGRKGRRFAALGWFPCGALVGYMTANQVTERVQADDGRSVGRKR
jgi:hypothetical protein